MDDIIHVPAQKPRKSPCKIAFLGEAPSSEELLEGKPLVGPAGKVFDALLRTANLDRADYWVGNVFDQKLPGNEVGNWCVTKAEAEACGWDPFPSIPEKGVLRPEHRWHLSRMAADLDAVQPNVIVPMGDTALWALTRQYGIGTYRGNLGMSLPILTRDYKILPTYHPAYIIQAWKFYSVVVADFNKAARAAEEGPKLTYPKKTVILSPSIPEIHDYVHELMKSDLICPDIETGWGQMTCIGFAANANSAICIPFVDLSKPNKSYWDTVQEELNALMAVKAVMECPIPKLGQNFAAYDAFWLLDKYGIKTMNLLHDTRLLHHALYPELPKSLSFMAGSYTMQGAWKHWGHKGQQEKKDD